MTHPLFGKTSAAIGVMLALLAVPYASPKLSKFRVARAPWDPKEEIAAESEVSRTVAAPAPTQGEAKLEASKNEGTVTNSLPENPALDAPSGADLAKAKGSLGIEDPTGHAMDAFYTRLFRTKKKETGAVTRIEHYGDSVITSDYISGTMRRKMQAEFGDAGHGFILAAKPWDWYFHNDVVMGASEGWSSSKVTGPFNRDASYGIGGVSFVAQPGATAWYGTAHGETYGKKVSRFDVYYMETPNGGDIELKADGKSETFSTKADSHDSKIHSFPVTDGENKMTLRVVSGTPRLFGVALERDVPGVVYDALGANGGRGSYLANVNPDHWKQQFDLRDPALIILQYGTNESEAGMADREAYEKTQRALLDKVKAAAPNASVLVLAPLDRAQKVDGELRTMSVIKKLVDAQRKVAGEAGVAFWNTFEAMGGEGSMATWVKKGLAGSDLTHPSPKGGEVLGDLLYQALTSGYEAWSKGTRPGPKPKTN
jgi:lysophospholipase L1-like esterase